MLLVIAGKNRSGFLDLLKGMTMEMVWFNKLI
jgi:hypothetical protein